MTTPVLTDEEVKSFREKGYLLYHKQLLSTGQLDRLNEIYEDHRRLHADKQGDEFDTPHFEDERLFEFLLAEPVLDLVECLIGGDLALWSSHFICKDPKVGRATPWHEDSSYWTGRLDRYDRIVTVWLALDDIDRENGCMQVIPGSHLAGGFSEYRAVDAKLNTFPTEIAGVPLDNAVPFNLRRGECSLHDGRIMHGADPNLSDRRRLGYTMRYISAALHAYPEVNRDHRLWLARGHPVADNRYQNA
jgi:ectoine hydroxylase-related dioxygenase (phytanoyl-CoA dioxygenase family)